MLPKPNQYRRLRHNLRGNNMDRSYKNKLLREATEHPERLVTHQKFWKLEWWPHYLRRCDDLLYDDPQAGLAVVQYAPQLAAKIAEANPGTNGADLLILAYSYLGGGYRRTAAFGPAKQAFNEAADYRDSASPKALAEYLRRLAYFLLFQKDAACFDIIGEAIAIHKRGNLVDRHAFGECLVCRGHAYVEFNQPGRAFDDWTASLNHVSLKIDDKPWYCALHNLAVWAADFGTDEELRQALENLKPALVLLYTYRGRPFAKLKLRWLIAVIDARLGRFDRAEAVFLEVRDGLVKMKLGYEVGMIQIDLALVFLAQDRRDELEGLVDETADIFRRIGVEAKTEEALDVWRQAEEVDEDLLKRVRRLFAEGAQMVA